MINRNKLFFAILPMLLILFIDGLGQGIVFPILVRSLTDIHSTVLIASPSPALRSTLYGLVVGIFFLCWFFGVPILSDLSDRFGRKITLMICLFGTIVGYFLSVIAFEVHHITFLILGRAIDGMTAASQPIAQAAIVDLSDEQTKTQNMGYILLALSVGIISGPFIGGFLSDSHLIGWFAIETPLYFALLLSVVNIIMLFFLFQETHVREKVKQTAIQFSRAINVFISAFQHKTVRYVALCLLLAQSSWALFYFYLTEYMALKFHYSATEAAMIFGVMAVGLCIGFGYLIKKLQAYLSLKTIILIGYTVLTISTLVIVLTGSAISVWISVPFISAFVAAGYGCYMGVFSNQVDKDKQGWVMGVTGGVNAIAGGVSAIFAGILSNISYDLPIILTIILSLAATLLFYFFKEA